MKTFASLALAFSSLIATVSGHGYIVSPPRRAPGTEMAAVCGQTIYNNQASDNAGPVQLLLQSASSIVDIDACNLWLCKGYQFADNTAQVQTYSLGQTIPMEVKIVAPHTGYANVSIVDTKTNTVKGSFLKSWSVYASTATGVTAGETDFSVTIPTDLTGCTAAGECVIQWFWYAPPGVDQTYEGCIDFIIGDGTAASTSAAVTSTTTPTTTTSAVPITSVTTEAPTTSVVEAPTTSTTVKVPTPPSIVELPTSTAVAAPVTTAAPTESTSAPTETTSKATLTSETPTTTPTSTPTIPTTLITKTRTSTTTPAASSSCATTPVDYNKCLDAANVCIRNAQSKSGGAVNFSACDAQRAACRMC